MSTDNPEQEQLVEVARIASEGRKELALSLLEDILRLDADNTAAWKMMVRLAPTRARALDALRQLRRLEPDNIRVQELLERLESRAQEAERKKDRSGFFWLIGAGAAAFVFLLLLVYIFIGPLWRESRLAESGLGDGMTDSESVLAEVADLPLSNCQGLVNRALDVSDRGCRQIGTNQVCYGNYHLDAVLSPDTTSTFSLIGDVINIQNLEQIAASPLDPSAGQWGIAVFKVQADVSRTVPGQTVTFLVFGNTSIENTSGDMHAFYFSTGFGAVTCAEVAFDGILIDMPDGTSLSFMANGTELTVSGTGTLQARDSEKMTLSMMNGEATVRAAGQQQTLAAGQGLSVPLGGENGLEASGPPSAPQSLPEAVTTLLCLLTGQNCPEELADTLVPSGTEVPTNTAVQVDPGLSTNTPVPVASGLPTNTSVPLATNTPVPTHTPSTTPLSTDAPTNTPVPTHIPSTTPLPTDAPTNTPVPTHTPSTTPLPTDAPTNTPVPTDTEVPQGSCSDIEILWVDPANFDIQNGYGSPIVLIEIELTWNDTDTGQLKQVTLSGPAIAAGNLGPSKVSLSLSADVNKRTIVDGGTKTLSFGFEHDPVDSGYYVSVTFDVGCTRSTSH